jgi:hypothetical protein
MEKKISEASEGIYPDMGKSWEWTRSIILDWGDKVMGRGLSKDLSSH